MAGIGATSPFEHGSVNDGSPPIADPGGAEIKIYAPLTECPLG
jgi:hypothetical protein